MEIDQLNPTDADTVKPKWDRHAFKNLGIISVTITLAPFVLWIVWNVLKGWGQWRILRPEHRPHYVRTWHGWVEGEKAATKSVERVQLRDHIRQKLVWRTTTTDYSWVFWDPSGAKRQEYEDNRRHSMLRHFPRWMRSYEPGSLWPDARITSDRLAAAEEGKVSMRAYRHSSEIQPWGVSFTENESWREWSSKKGADPLTENHKHSDSLPMMTGALADSRNAHILSTVRRRKPSRGRIQVWDANGQETFRATCPVPRQAENLDADVDPARESGASSLRVQPSPTSQNVAAGFARRACSLPLFAILPKAYHARPRSKYPVETLPGRFQKKPILYPARVCDHHSAPENSEDLQGSGQITTRLRNPEDNLRASDKRNLTRTFHHAFEPLANPVVLNPFISIGNEYSGTAGRPGSPSMGWTIQGTKRAAVGELSLHEAEEPVKGASIVPCSSCSSDTFRSRPDGEYPDMHLHEASSQETKDSPDHFELDTDGTMDRHRANFRVSDGFFQGSYLPGDIALHFSLLRRNTSPKNLTSNPSPRTPRSRKVTSESEPLLAEHSSDTERLSKFLRVDSNMKRGSTHPPRRIKPKPTTRVPCDVPMSSKETRSPTKSITPSTTHAKTTQTGSTSGTSRFIEAKKETTKPAASLSSFEKTFLADLDLRLGRLDYELSPGFRGPPGEHPDPKWWFEGVPYSASVASRGSRAFANRGTLRLRPLNPPPVPRRSRTAVDVSKTIDQAVPTSLTQRRASSQDSVRPRGTCTYNREPGEGEIDTAAWMLRRPPMGALREDSAEKTLLFTSGRGNAKTLLEWQRSDSLLSLQQAFDAASAISRRPAKRLKRLGILGSDRNNGCSMDGKQPTTTAFDGCEAEGQNANSTTTTRMSAIQRILTRVSSLAVDERRTGDSPLGYTSPNRTMMH